MDDNACVYDIVLKGEVIYVGMTNNPERRLKQHRCTGVAPEGAEMHVFKWYSSRERAFKAEYLRQLELLPVHCTQIAFNTKPEKPDYDWDEHKRKLQAHIEILTDKDYEHINSLYEKYRANNHPA